MICRLIAINNIQIRTYMYTALSRKLNVVHLQPKHEGVPIHGDTHRPNCTGLIDFRRMRLFAKHLSTYVEPFLRKNCTFSYRHMHQAIL